MSYFLQDSSLNYWQLGVANGGLLTATAVGGPHAVPTHPNIGSIFEDRWVGTIMNMYRQELTREDNRNYAEGSSGRV